MTKKQIDLCYRALRQNDGHTMAPNWPIDDRRQLSTALDALRLYLQTGCVPQEETIGLKGRRSQDGHSLSTEIVRRGIDHPGHG